MTKRRATWGAEWMDEKQKMFSVLRLSYNDLIRSISFGRNFISSEF